MENSRLLKAFATIAPFLGPILLAIRAEEATAFEKFLYVTMAGPLVIIAVSLRYVEEKKSLLTEPDSMNRHARMKEKQDQFRIVLTIVIVASSVMVGLAAWLLFGQGGQ